jgi:hypothetical protein
MSNAQKIQAEISALYGKQNKAVKDATFLGWDQTEAAAYAERAKRIAVLRAQLAEIDPTIEYLA